MPQSIIAHKFKLFMMVLVMAVVIQAYGNANPLANLGLPTVLPADQAFAFELANHDNQLEAHWDIAPGCYLYQERLQLSLSSKTLAKISLLSPNALPAAKIIQDPYFGPQAIYENALAISLPMAAYLHADQPSPLVLEVDYQGCTETGFCYPPTSKRFEIKIAHSKIQGISALTEATTPTLPLASSELKTPELKPTLPTTMASFYLIGLLLAFSPCVLPMIPILLGIIVGQKHLNTRKSFWLSLSYVLAMAFTYALAGIIAATLGKNLQATLQQPVVITLFAGLFIYLGLAQIGAVRLAIPHRLRFKEFLTKIHAKQESGTYVGAAIMGILATLISSPCVTAPLIGALGYISQSGDIWLGGSALLAMGLGMGSVLLVIGTVGGKYVPKSGPWMHSVNQAFAILMFGFSLWLLDRIFRGPTLLAAWGVLCIYAAWCLGTFRRLSSWPGRLGILLLAYAVILFWGVIEGASDPLKPLCLDPWRQQAPKHNMTMRTITNLDAFNQAQQQAQEQHLPLLVIFYASWCTSCQQLEHSVFADPQIQQRLKNWVVIRADVTAYNEESQVLLQHFSLIGPPAMLFFDVKGSEIGNQRIIGTISLADFNSRLNKLENLLGSQIRL